MKFGLLGLLRLAFRVMLHPREIRKVELAPPNYFQILPFMFCWGFVWAILQSFFLYHPSPSRYLYCGAIAIGMYYIALWELYSLFLSSILRQPLRTTECGVFFLWALLIPMPFFDFPHLLGLRVFSRWFGNLMVELHTSLIFAFPMVAIESFYLIERLGGSRWRALTISFFLPIAGKFVIGETPHIISHLFPRIPSDTLAVYFLIALIIACIVWRLILER